MNLLLVRTDRIGDAVLSAPAAAAVKALSPHHRVSFLVRSYTAPVYQASRGIDELLIDQEDCLKRGGSWSGFFRLLRKIRSRRFDAVVLLHAEFRPALLTALAGIPVRVAPASKAWQFLANHRIKQKRSRCEHHELEYNLDLVRRLLPDLPHRDPELHLAVGENESSPGHPSEPYVLIHPGSGGSARNGSVEFYSKLALSLTESGHSVQISWGPGEESLAAQFRDLPGVNVLTAPPALDKLLELLAAARVVITGSTGPLHLAAGLGRPTISLFCPIRVCTPHRWGPRPTAQATVLMPENIPPCERCIHEACPYWDCMEKITVDQVINALDRIP